MGIPVKVTKVTIEYASGGKTFSLTFPDPEKISSIHFDKVDFERTRRMQETETKKAVKEHILSGDRLTLKSFGGPATESSTPEATVKDLSKPSPLVGTEFRSLWWHTSACSWFHPEGDG